MTSSTLFDAALRKFAQELHPTESEVKNGKEAVEKVIGALKEAKRFDIDRAIYSGSIAKNTALPECDFDVVLFVNNVSPKGKGPGAGTYEDTLGRIETFLKHEFQGQRTVIMDIFKNAYSVQFKLKNQLNNTVFDVDLLVAANLVKGNNGRSGQDVAERQRIETMKIINGNPSQFDAYSSALVESQVDFMRRQDSFTHCVVKLAKYWYKQLNLGSGPAGLKMTLELLAVHSAQYVLEGRKSCAQSISSAFRNFLDRVRMLKTMKIYFNLETGKCVREICAQLKNPNSKVAKDIPLEFHSKAGFVLDPANPYNDVSKNIVLNAGFYENLRSAAALSNRKFDAGERAFVGVGNFQFKNFI